MPWKYLFHTHISRVVPAAQSPTWRRTNQMLGTSKPQCIWGKPPTKHITQLVKYLDVRLDGLAKLQYPRDRNPLRSSKSPSDRIFHALAPHLFGWAHTPLTIHLLFLRSTVTYAAPPWWSLLSTNNNIGWSYSNLAPYVLCRGPLVLSGMASFEGNSELLSSQTSFGRWLGCYSSWQLRDLKISPPPKPHCGSALHSLELNAYGLY